MTHQQSFGNAAALIALGAALNPAAQQVVNVVTEAARAKEATAEQIYQDWLNIVGERIAGEQLLLGTASSQPYVLADEEQGMTGESELFVVLNFLDGLSSRVFTRRVDVGELSNYMSGDARRWRTLLRDLRIRSSGAHDTARYHQLTRALAALEFLSSEPITDAQQRNFSLEGVIVDLQENANELTIRGSIRSRATGAVATPNIAICLRDFDGNVCGETIVTPTYSQMYGHQLQEFETIVQSRGDVSDVECNFTRRRTTEQDFALDNVKFEAHEDPGKTIIRGTVRSRIAGPAAAPNVEICLRDADGKICGETIVVPQTSTMQGHEARDFEETVQCNATASKVEAKLRSPQSSRQ